jgi:hypothetical protein
MPCGWLKIAGRLLPLAAALAAGFHAIQSDRTHTARDHGSRRGGQVAAIVVMVSL